MLLEEPLLLVSEMPGAVLPSSLAACWQGYIMSESLHVQEREAAQRAADLARRALEAEKRLVEAMKDEAAASSELLDAERAAKFAAQVWPHPLAAASAAAAGVLCMTVGH
jgi:hypothetical protein